jgi:hypothetical protein
LLPNERILLGFSFDKIFLYVTGQKVQLTHCDANLIKLKLNENNLQRNDNRGNDIYNDAYINSKTKAQLMLP